MSKPEIVCKVGSGALALAATLAGVVLLSFLAGLLWVWFHITLPVWAVVFGAVVSIFTIPIAIRELYRYLFDHCRAWNS